MWAKRVLYTLSSRGITGRKGFVRLDCPFFLVRTSSGCMLVSLTWSSPLFSFYRWVCVYLYILLVFRLVMRFAVYWFSSTILLKFFFSTAVKSNVATFVICCAHSCSHYIIYISHKIARPDSRNAIKNRVPKLPADIQPPDATLP